MSVLKYDIAGMRKAAGEIREEMNKYKTAMDEMTEIVKGTRTYFQDDRQKQYVEKYDAMSPAMDEVKKAMEAYAKFLEDAATYFEKQSKTSI